MVRRNVVSVAKYLRFTSLTQKIHYGNTAKKSALKLPLNVNCVNPLVITKDPSTLHSVPLFSDSDPVGSGVFACFGSGSGFQISLDQQFLIKNLHKIDGKFSRQRCLDPDPDPVCPERLDPDTGPDPVNIRPDPQPWKKWII